MPAFQRQYVWSMDQIEKLWDSILLDYPIATFLFWHVDNDNVSWDTYFCNFMSSVTFDFRKQADSVNYELSSIDVSQTDTAILDGQQRLTSLFLSLYGEPYIRQKNSRKKSYGGLCTKLLIELNKDKLDVDEEEYNSKKYDIRFSDKIGRYSPTQFEIRRILDEKFQNVNTREQAIEDAITNVPPSSKDYAKNILNKLCSKIYDECLIRYTEIHGMNSDDALEMFVRFNSGGKALKKSEITMSIMEAYWPNAKTEFGKILQGPYESFGSDFIIRAALMLFGDVVKSNINRKVTEELKNNWKEFKNSLLNMVALLNKLNINVSHFSGSWNVLLPILYFIYYNPNYEEFIQSVRSYLMRAIFFTYFQSGTTGKLQQMRVALNNFNFEFSNELLDQIGDLRVTEGKIEDILNAEKGSRVANEVLYYLSLDWRNDRFKYEQDHLHPYERFNQSPPMPVKMTDWSKWRSDRNRLPNLQLLEGRENGGKNDMPLIEYYNQMTDNQKDDFRKNALIPDGISLEIKDFGEFYAARKALLKEKIVQFLR